MSYPGSKAQAGTWQRIIGQMPPHHTFVEAFYGSGFISRHKKPAVINVAVDKLKRVLPREQHEPIFIQAVHDCFVDWATRVLLDGPDDQESTLVYCDPPYPLSTRNGRRLYDHEMTDHDHTSLLTLLQELKCRVLISGYPCALYSSQLRDWRCLSYWAMTRGGKRRECLWCNFPEPEELHDWRYAGQNFRQRTSLKRLAARWLAKLDRMKPRQRGYVLNAIAQRQT